MRKPREKPEYYTKMRARALAHVKSVPYKVSLRWLFYRMLQDGVYVKTKADYDNFKNFIAGGRKRMVEGWDWDTLVDETRTIINRGTGEFNKKEWLQNLEDCKLDKIQTQDYFLIIGFEARAMINQFRAYTKNIPLIAFSGDASLDIKDRIAKELEWASARYNKPIVFLYFGDCDVKGKQIADTALKDIQKRCSVNITIIFCGLTLQQALAFKLPVNPEKPTQYQWEALDDKQAMELITKNVEKYQDEKRFDKIIKQEKTITKWYRNKLK